LVGCAGKLKYAPSSAVEGSANAVSAELRGIAFVESDAAVDLQMKAPQGAVLVDGHVTRLPATPCATTGGEQVTSAVTHVLIDEHEDYHAGPADLSGTGHRVTLHFLAFRSLWRNERLAIDLELAPSARAIGSPAPACLRLELPGIEGAGWSGEW
jgi:hypothetical protein